MSWNSLNECLMNLAACMDVKFLKMSFYGESLKIDMVSTSRVAWGPKPLLNSWRVSILTKKKFFYVKLLTLLTEEKSCQHSESKKPLRG